MKKNTDLFSKFTIKRKVQFIFSTAISFCVLVSFIFFISFMRINITEAYLEKSVDMANSIEKSYNSVMGNVSNISRLIMVNDTVVTYLRSENPDKIESINDNVAGEIYTILNSFSKSYTALIFRNDKKYVKTAIGIIKPDCDIIFQDNWYGHVSSLNGGYDVFPNTSGAFTLNTKTGIVSFARIINDIDTQKPLGMLVINIPVDELEETFRNFSGNENGFAYLDADGNILCSDMNETVLESILSEKSEYLKNDYAGTFGRNRIINSRIITDTGITLICCYDIHFFEDISSEMLISLIVIFVIVSVMVVIISKCINRYITYPITKLSEAMKNFGDGTPAKLDIISYDDEIGQLQDCYNDMAYRIDRLLEEVVEQEKQRQRAEMNVVQEQMKPHFLYNTLATIGCMALQNSREEVYDAIETLSTFYRKFLSKGNESITLADEISIVKSYIKLLRLRYDDMFEDFYDIQEDLNSIHVLKLILQPLVENSIYHGIRPKGEEGIIKISVYSQDNRIHIVVYDSGVGMSEEEIKQLLSNENTNSFGFKGTIDRIKNFYQNDVYINIKSVVGEYCEIEIIVPLPH